MLLLYGNIFLMPLQVGLLRRKEVTYFYAADQFKGMRQDCTVQHLQNEASAAIYEAHARCALEHGDMAEFNQCQAQLLQHYKAGIVGCRPEFTAYRVIHQSVHAGKGDQAALLTCLQSISPEVSSFSSQLLSRCKSCGESKEGNGSGLLGGGDC